MALEPLSLAAEICAAARSLPAPLASASDAECFGKLAPFLPAAVHSYGFELRLAPGGDVIDFGAALAPQQRAADALACVTHEGPGWHLITAFGRRWRDPASASWRSIPFVFLEYDAEAVQQTLPVPSLFAALDSPLCRKGAGAGLFAAREAASTLRAEPLSSALMAHLEACFGLLPDGGRMLHVAVMLGRPEQSLRLSVLLPRAAVAAYFEALGAQRAGESARQLIECCRERSREVQLDFDIGPPIASRVGLGLFSDSPAGWWALLGDVVQLGICEPRKILALMDWAGEGPAVAGGAARLRRRLSHLKLCVASDGGLEAKAYLGVSRLVSRAAADRDPGRAMVEEASQAGGAE